MVLMASSSTFPYGMMGELGMGESEGEREKRRIAIDGTLEVL